MAIVEVFDEDLCTLGEGPCWDAETESLFWIDIDRRKIFQKNARTGQRLVWNDEVLPGSVANIEGKPHSLLVADAIGFRELDLTTGSFTTLVERLPLEPSWPNSRFNDGKCDAKGRFWAGTMDTNPDIRYHGSLYRLDPDLSVSMHRTPVSISNGLAWTSDNKTLYYIDSPVKKMVAWDYDLEKGTVSNERIAFSIDGTSTIPYLPTEKFDGQTIDSEGMLWVAIWGGSCVRRYDPKDGRILGEVKLPCPNITSCCFGGPNFEDLYITTADYGSRKAFPEAGKTFVAKNFGARGLPFFKFKLGSNK